MHWERHMINLWSGIELESFNYGKRLVIYIHQQQILICCTACLQAPSISVCSIDISACSTIVSNINHPAEPLEMILIGRWWWWRSEPQRGVSAAAKPTGNMFFRWQEQIVIFSAPTESSDSCTYIIVAVSQRFVISKGLICPQVHLCHAVPSRRRFFRPMPLSSLPPSTVSLNLGMFFSCSGWDLSCLVRS
jgi:hypothetical protein